MRTKPARRGPLEGQARAMLTDSATAVRRVSRACAGAVAEAAELAITALQNGGSMWFCGNGGSAADAQHLACELAGRFMLDRAALPATALTTNTSSLTAIGNDFGYDDVFARQLDGVGRRGDVLVAITTSGRSVSVRRAIEVARKRGLSVIGMTGAKGREFAAMCDVALVTPHAVTPRIQEGHIAMGHALCELIERALFATPSRAAAARAAAAPARRPARGKTRAARTTRRTKRSGRRR
jgi:D-sedoheptulose 7-phosphate isomerase